MRVCFARAANGDHIAKTTLPVMGGNIILVARVSDQELRAMYQRHACAGSARSGEKIGFRLSLKSLGGAIKALAKPAVLLKVTMMAGRIAAGDPTALLAAPGLLKTVREGMAAKKVMEAAADGNPRAQAVIQRARAAAEAGQSEARAPGIHPGVMRYLVTVQTLARAS